MFCVESICLFTIKQSRLHVACKFHQCEHVHWHWRGSSGPVKHNCILMTWPIVCRNWLAVYVGGDRLNGNRIIVMCSNVTANWQLRYMCKRRKYEWSTFYKVYQCHISCQLSGWPSGLRRQTQGCTLPALLCQQGNCRFLVHECGRGFESHFWHWLLFNRSNIVIHFQSVPWNNLEGHGEKIRKLHAWF